MSEEVNAPPPPKGLGERGRDLWDRMNAVLEFEVKESELLTEACRVLDRIDALEEILLDGITSTGSTGQTVIHPAVAELRQQQLTFGKLTDLLRLPEDISAQERKRSDRAKAGSDGRWLRAVGRG